MTPGSPKYAPKFNQSNAHNTQAAGAIYWRNTNKRCRFDSTTYGKYCQGSHTNCIQTAIILEFTHWIQKSNEEYDKKVFITNIANNIDWFCFIIFFAATIGEFSPQSYINMKVIYITYFYNRGQKLIIFWLKYLAMMMRTQVEMIRLYPPNLPKLKLAAMHES